MGGGKGKGGRKKPPEEEIEDELVELFQSFDPDDAGPLTGTKETFTATVNWGDGTGDKVAEVTVTNGSAGTPTTGTISGTHTYAAPFQAWWPPTQ